MCQILNEAGNGAVDATDQSCVCFGDVVVTVPGTGVELDKTDTLLDELASQQATASEMVGVGISDPVQLLGLPGFTIQVNDIWNLHLHAKGKFVIPHSRCQLLVLWMSSGMALVELLQEIEIATLLALRDTGRRREIE